MLSDCHVGKEPRGTFCSELKVHILSYFIQIKMALHHGGRVSKLPLPRGSQTVMLRRNLDDTLCRVAGLIRPNLNCLFQSEFKWIGFLFFKKLGWRPLSCRRLIGANFETSNLPWLASIFFIGPWPWLEAGSSLLCETLRFQSKKKNQLKKFAKVNS